MTNHKVMVMLCGVVDNKWMGEYLWGGSASKEATPSPFGQISWISFLARSRPVGNNIYFISGQRLPLSANYKGQVRFKFRIFRLII